MIPTELNDAACIIVQLEPGDDADIKSLRDSLRHFAVFDAAASTIVRAHTQRAATALSLILLDPAADAAALLVSAGEAIEAAIAAADSSLPASVPSVLQPSRTGASRADADRIPADADLSLLSDFIAESRESMAGAEVAMLALEANPEDIESISTIFRAFHTVKGTAAFMGLDALAEFAHHAESLLSRVRDRELAYTQTVANLALRSSDVLGALLTAIEQSVETQAAIALPGDYDALMHDLLNADNLLPAVASRVVEVAGLTPAADATGPSPARSNRSEADLSVRVRTDRLDRLIDMVGELVIAHSMIAADLAAAASTQHDLTRKVAQSGKIMRELQELSMSMRMVPLKPTFQKLTRLVRDVAQRSGKLVELVTHGDETELDRTMVDAIADPLVHMVRNAIDHGIESPDERVRAGKSRGGRLTLTAVPEGGSVVVVLRDDGRGLNRDRILAKAVEKGLVPSTHALTDAEIHALIFAPGFSTAEQLTDLSGRGVGMDVVRRNIDAIRGRVDIDSVPGEGTTFHIRVPLTLAVTDGMLVRVGDERYLVPLTSISLSFRPGADMLSRIPPAGEMVRQRGEVLPIVRLHRMFGIADAVIDACDGILMIVGDGDQRVALLVDQLLGQQQVVARPLGDGIGEVPGIAGGAILSDGRVGLIIDVARMTTLARSGDVRSSSHASAA